MILEYSMIYGPRLPWFATCVVCDKPLSYEPLEEIIEFIVGKVGEQIPVYSHLNHSCGKLARDKIREKSGIESIPIVEIPYMDFNKI